jgi:ribosomal protein S18 acetylase RimI-like enzyme
MVTRDTIADVEPLDNPGWHALTGPHREFAETVDGLAARYQPEVGAFCALPDEVSTDSWDALRMLVGPGSGAVIFRRVEVTPPEGWSVLTRMTTRQMLGPEEEPSDDKFDLLGAQDVPAMLELVALTRPGPFFARTHELGAYLGHRDDSGALVAMAGERMRCGGRTEISAVCTNPSHRGQGLASRLVRAVGAHATARGELPMLHVLDENTSAISVYEALGYTTRMRFQV